MRQARLPPRLTGPRPILPWSTPLTLGRAIIRSTRNTIESFPDDTWNGLTDTFPSFRRPKWFEWVSPAMRNDAHHTSQATLCVLCGRAHEVNMQYWLKKVRNDEIRDTRRQMERACEANSSYAVLAVGTSRFMQCRLGRSGHRIGGKTMRRAFQCLSSA